MKTYCISDIHGHLDNLYLFVKTLDSDDRVFVLGDAIDKGPVPLGCLEYIMEDSRFTMLLGNHEYMMFNTLSTEPGSYSYNDAFDLWVNWNEGGDTLDAYNALPRYKQLRIYDYIKRLPLNIPNVKVGDRTFYLVHSCPHSDIKFSMADVEYSDVKISSYVWDRVTPWDKTEIDNQIVIAGHTFVQEHLGYDVKTVEPVYDRKKTIGASNQSIQDAHYIDIDGGLATPFESAELIALCLDDLTYKLY